MAEVDQLYTQLGSPWRKGRGKGFMGLYRKNDMVRGQGPGKGKGQLTHGELPRRKGRKGLKWKTRL